MRGNLGAVTLARGGIARTTVMAAREPHSEVLDLRWGASRQDS
jgi:hypothetical protein